MSSLISISITPKTTVLPVSVADVKQDLRVDYPLTDAQIERYIRSSMQRLERYSCLVFVPSDVKAVYKQYGCGDNIMLGYFNGVDTTQPLTGMPDDGELDGAGNQWYLSTRAGKVTLEYEAGFTTLPDWAFEAIILDVAWRLEHYGDEALDNISPEAMNKIAPFRAYIAL